MSLLRYPYTNLHELNLDWIIEQLNNQDGPVRSVNGKTGFVTLTGEDINRSPNNPETVSVALTSQGQSIQSVRTQIGVTPLPTVAQTLTGAIAENAQEIADVEDNVIGSTELPTEAQTLTGAIAENADNIGGLAESITTVNNKIGNTVLPTTAQTLTGAVNELNSKIAYYIDIPVTISNADLINMDLPSLSGRKILATSFIYNSDFYYAIMDDNRQLYISLRDTNNTISVLQKGGTRTTDRTVTVRVHYAVS